MLGAGALPPDYVRNVTFVNASGHELLITGLFASNNKETICVDDGATGTIERNIDHGSYQLVDPLERVTIRRVGFPS